jgi:hypothetical protein
MEQHPFIKNCAYKGQLCKGKWDKLIKTKLMQLLFEIHFCSLGQKFLMSIDFSGITNWDYFMINDDFKKRAVPFEQSFKTSRAIGFK